MTNDVFRIVRFYGRFPLPLKLFCSDLLHFSSRLLTVGFTSCINNNEVCFTQSHINTLLEFNCFITKTNTPWLILLRKGKQFYRFYDVKS